MKHLDFILWIVLFPLSQSLAKYLEQKVSEMRNEKLEYSEGLKTVAVLIETTIVVWIAYKIY